MAQMGKILLLMLIELSLASLSFAKAETDEATDSDTQSNRKNNTHSNWSYLRKNTITVPATPKIHCFECDSRVDEECSENLTNLMLMSRGSMKIKTVKCNGSCVKMVVNSTEAYVRRSCTRNSWVSQLTSLSDSVCMGNSSRGENELCLCFNNYCNDGNSNLHISTTTLAISVASLLLGPSWRFHSLF